ncbi:recombinase family protein [Kineosporia sp. R_H_3]|uniref:recombinase family protein n=1 Tax=Kineosporia sp. R_H_3 TaxID=1961848 RepID=UPI000B4B53B3|nr:recombinase family protein [Kineosporia sp. R_H_3]
MTKAAVYLRQSLDRSGESAAVDRQRNACLALCAAREWEVVREYVDNGTSATKDRGDDTAFAQLLADASAGLFDVVVAFAVDRLARRLSDVERLIATGAKAATVQGGLDLTTPEGEAQAAILTAFARMEVRQKGLRQREMHVQRVAAGRPWLGSRALGWSADGMTLIDDEAELIREAAGTILAGGSLASVARAWNAAQLTTSRGRPWANHSVRTLLLNPRLAAKAARTLGHDRWEILGEGAWPAVLSEDVWLAVVSILRDPARRTTPTTARVSLLSGIASCGVCGGPLRTGANKGARTLRCAGPVQHLSRRAELIEKYVSDVVIERLGRPDAVALLAEDNQAALEAANDELAVKRERLGELADLLEDGTLTPAEVRATASRLRADVARLEAQVAEAARGDVLAPLIAADDAAAVWGALELGARRAVVAALVEVRVMSATRGRAKFSPTSVDVTFRD